MQTPLWVPLVVAAIGVLGTLSAGIAGVLITQRRSDRREEAAWARQREREREVWEREDRQRTFDHRRMAYEQFYEAVQTYANAVQGYRKGLIERVPDDVHNAAFELLQRLHIYAFPEVSKLSVVAYLSADTWEHMPGSDAETARRGERYRKAESELLDAMRSDLGIPNRWD